MISSGDVQAVVTGGAEATLTPLAKAAFAKMTTMMAKSDAPLPWATMHKVTAPTLLTWGRDDRVSPLDMSIIPMRTIPNAELHVFPNCGHWAMIERKAEFESTVLAYLAR